MTVVSVYDELERLLVTGSWGELVPYLHAPATSQTGKETRAWYRSRRAHWTGEVHYPEFDLAACLRALAVALAKPEQAARWLSKLASDWRAGPADELLVELASRRGRDWCVAFLETASTVAKGDGFLSAWIARLARPLIAAGLAELPTGPAFAKSWAELHAMAASEMKWALWRQERHNGTPEPLPTGSLVEELRADPVLPEALSAALAGPGVIGILERHAVPSWELGPAVAELVAEGHLDRSRILADAFVALTRQDTPSTQKGIAKLLAALDLKGPDLAERMPLVQGLLATSHGSVTAVLLPAAVETAHADDLPDLVATIFARPEKAQKTVLLKALTGPHAVDRWGSDAVTIALKVAADVPDQAFADRATKALTALGVAQETDAEAPLSDLWAAPLPINDTGPAAKIEADEPGLAAALSRIIRSTTAADGAVFWDAIVRWSTRSPQEVRYWAWSANQSLGDGVRPPSALWAVVTAADVTAKTHKTLCDKIANGVHAPTDWEIASLSLTGAVHEIFASETTLRLGTIPYLLSTPTQWNGLLSFDTLVDRLKGYGRTSAGPTDLFLALLRLEPTPPERTTQLDGLSLDLWSPGSRWRTAKHTGDAVDLLRQWIEGGGLPKLVTRHDGATVTVEPVRLPIDISLIPGIPAGLLVGHTSGTHREYHEWAIRAETGFGIVPAWPDLLAAKTQTQYDQAARHPPRWLPMMAHAPGPGLAVQHDIAATLCHADEDRRLLAVEAALALMGRGRWDSTAYTECCLHLLNDGVLRLGRLGHSWEQLILAGGLQPLWPTAMTVLGKASVLERKPAGLAELSGVLRRYVSAVPDPQIPESVLELAASKGSSKARVEAAAFVAAAAQGEGRA